MNPDFVDLLRAFTAADVRFLIVGAYALAVHGRPRATGDLDVWVEPTSENAARVMRALAAFGAPMTRISEADFAQPGVVYQIGVPPGRIDILTELTGLSFTEAWPGRLRRPFGDIDVDFNRCARADRRRHASGRRRSIEECDRPDHQHVRHRRRTLPDPQFLCRRSAFTAFGRRR
jgi:hypothetical protein